MPCSTNGNELVEPFNLYTIDVEEDSLEIVPLKENRKERARQKLERLKRRNSRWVQSFSMQDFINEDEDIQCMRGKIIPAFFTRFEEGLRLYMSGDWPEAVLA